MPLRPTIFFENVLDANEFARVGGNVEPDRVGQCGFGKPVAAAAAIAEIANLTHLRFFRLERRNPGAALSRVGVS